MATEIQNIRVTTACDVPVGGTVRPYEPGDYAVTEAIADRIVAAGCGERLLPKGGRLKAAIEKAEGAPDAG